MQARRPPETNMRHGENAMFEILDRRTSLTRNQIKILTAAIIGDALEFFDYFLIGFVLAFLIGPWKLTFGAVMGAFMGSDQWRLLFAIGVLPALLVLLVRLWVPESPRWLCRQGRYEEARRSLAWALQMAPSALPMPTAADAGPVIKSNWLDLFKYPRSLIVSWLGNAGAQTGVYGITLWAPSLFVLLLKVTPQQASKMMILLTISGFIGRLSFSFFSELMGRRNAGGLLGFGAGVMTIVAGYHYDAMLFGLSAFWLLLAITFFFADGGFAIVGPYAAEVWPSHLRTSGMGSAYGFGGIGKIIGPVGLALIVGSGNYLKPDVPLPQIPTAFVYLGCWFLMAGIVYYFLGIETKGKSIEQIDKELTATADLATATVRRA